MMMGSMAAALAAYVVLPLSVLSASPASLPEIREAAPPPVAAFPCELVTSQDAARVLGGTPSGPYPMPDRVDEESGARLSGCSFERGERGIAIMIAAFDSRAAVERAMETLTAGGDDVDSIRLSPVSGPGERSLWGSSEDGAIWVVLQGQRILTVTLFGEVPDPASHRDAMRALAEAVVSAM
jgi:hypothetical protein